MYNVLLKNYQTKEQKKICRVAYKNRALEFCEEEVLDFVLQKEGEKYLKKKFYRKSKLPVGFSIVKGDNKFTVYHREPSGYVFSGEIKKIFTVFIFKTKNLKEDRSESEMTIESREYFERVLKDIKKNYVDYDANIVTLNEIIIEY